MSARIVVFGYGPVGAGVVERLQKRGDDVAVAQRTRPKMLPPGVGFEACDVLDGGAVKRVVQGAAQIVVAIGFPYVSRVWQEAWPRAMGNLLAACEASGARMLFFDNLYMYGPQRDPLREDMTLSSYGVKPAVRSEITRMWQTASDAGRVRVAALRASDFYGPGVTLSHVGETGFKALALGKRAMLVVPPDMPHDFAYVPDIARAALTLLDAPDDAYGQAWHVPTAPIVTPRQLLTLGANALGVPLRLSTIPLWALPVLGLAVPILRETNEMKFQWDRPYHVDASKFAHRFWSDVTPLDVGAATTARSFLPAR